MAAATRRRSSSSPARKLRDDLTLPGLADVFVLGEMAAVPDVPGVAQGAIQEDHYVARVYARAPRPAPLRYERAA